MAKVTFHVNKNPFLKNTQGTRTKHVLNRRPLVVSNQVNLKSMKDNQFGFHVTEIELKNNKIPKSFLKLNVVSKSLVV